jgi:hypothetical protein
MIVDRNVTRNAIIHAHGFFQSHVEGNAVGFLL